MRFSGWVCLVLGVASLFAAGVLGVLAIRQAMEISAYQHARACPAGASRNADCLGMVHGSVAAVTEFPGGYRVSADYALDVRTASTTLHLTFSSDSPMLGYAVDGAPALVTMWRGVPVSVVTDGRSAVTTSVPATAFARDLGNSEKAGGVGVFLVLAALAIRRNRRTGGPQPLTRPVLAALLSAGFLGGVVVLIGGVALGGKPSRLGPDLAVTGAALVLVAGLSAWVGMRFSRRASGSPANVGHAQARADDAHDLNPPVLPTSARTASPGLRMYQRPAIAARVLGARAAGYVPVLLTVAVLFGVFFSAKDGPAARAFQHAPGCAGDETNLATCAGDFTAIVNGVRAPANAASFTDVSYVTYDGAINTWARFDGNAASIARMATADEQARTQLKIEVWRRQIVGAELGGSWRWADGNPPGNTIPVVFLAVSFALLLLLTRLRIHLRAGAKASRRRLIIDDLGQVTAAAGAVVLLAYGFWPGAILALGVLLWLGYSARRSAQPRRVRLGAPRSS